MTPKPRLSKNPQRAARLRYRQRRYDLAIAAERLKTAATEALTFAGTPPMRDEMELILRELERFIAVTDLKVEWPELTPERREAFRNVLEGLGGQRRKPQQ
jgi:hypothetical protein